MDQPTPPSPHPERPSEGGWTFLSNHAHVLLCLSREPELRLRDVAEAVGITERAVQRIVSDLEEAGYLTRERTGRRNRYQIHPDLPLRHPIESHCKVKALISLVNEPVPAARP
jgi:DNA-binding Lrp family transcriptional regulator